MADVLVLAFFRFAWLCGRGRVSPLENLHAGLFVGTDNSAPLLVETECIAVELTDVMGFGGKVGIVAIEPLHAPMRLEVGFFHNAPEAGATHGVCPSMLLEGDHQIIQTPPGGGTMYHGGFAGGQ